METIVFGNFTVMDIIIAAVVVIGFLYLWPAVKKVFRKKEAPVYAQDVKCNNCDWQGQVSKHAGRCPKCNNPIGDQRAKKYQ